MKVSIVTTASLFIAMVGLGVASADDMSKDTPQPHSMTGCLQQGSAPDTFKLTDLGLENGPQTVEIAEATADLAPHVGHKVEITGTTIEGTDPAAHTMKITDVKHLAATCP